MRDLGAFAGPDLNALGQVDLHLVAVPSEDMVHRADDARHQEHVAADGRLGGEGMEPLGVAAIELADAEGRLVESFIKLVVQLANRGR